MFNKDDVDYAMILCQQCFWEKLLEWELFQSIVSHKPRPHTSLSPMHALKYTRDMLRVDVHVAVAKLEPRSSLIRFYADAVSNKIKIEQLLVV